MLTKYLATTLTGSLAAFGLMLVLAATRPTQAAPAETSDTAAATDDASAESSEEQKATEAKKAKAERKRAARKRARDAEASHDEETKPTDAADENGAAKKASPAKAAAAKQPAAKKPAEKPADDAAAAKTAAKEPVKKAAGKSVAAISLTGGYPDGPTQPGLFSDLQPSLAEMVRRIDAAADDKQMGALLLRIGDLSVGSGQVHELRAAIGRVRKAGKPVYAALDSAESGQYLVASACDQVLMAPSGMLILPGMRAEMVFFKGLFDKLGIQYEVLQMGKYKGAGEPFSRTEMSPALRESMEAIVDDSYEAMLDYVAADRKLDRAKVEELVDQALFTAAAAKEAGLVDQLIYRDEIEGVLAKTLRVDEAQITENYGKKKVDTDFSGVTGMMKFFQMVLGVEPTEETGAEKKIAVVYASGPIMTGESASSLLAGEIVGSTTLVKTIREAAEDDDVVAIVLRIDSPGGSAVASDLIWREVTRTEKPIIASMGDVAASGGYYIAMGADKIVAEPGTITGSIGVIGGKPVVAGLMDKIGVTTDVISRGKRAGLFSLTESMTEDDRAALTTLLEDVYDQFVSKAAKGRDMPREKLEELAQGRVYTGRMAVENGLIDKLGTLADAVTEAKTAAGLEPDAKVDIITLPEPKSLFEELFAEPSVQSRVDGLVPDVFRPVAEAELYQRLFGEHVLTLMPCQVELK